MDSQAEPGNQQTGGRASRHGFPGSAWEPVRTRYQALPGNADPEALPRVFASSLFLLTAISRKIRIHIP
jgi:hypothetical protein